MKCITCGAKTVADTTSDVTDLKKCLLVVRNVPCHKCMECNEIIYNGGIVKKLDEIIKSVTQSINEITVIDFNNIAA